jgi:hypothetical protein
MLKPRSIHAMPHAPTPAPAAVPPPTPQVVFDATRKAVVVLPTGHAKPAHADVFAQCFGAVAPRARSLCEKHPALASVRKLQSELADAKVELARVVGQTSAFVSELGAL